MMIWRGLVIVNRLIGVLFTVHELQQHEFPQLSRRQTGRAPRQYKKARKSPTDNGDEVREFVLTELRRLKAAPATPKSGIAAAMHVCRTKQERATAKWQDLNL